jgi:hypothetical protein
LDRSLRLCLRDCHSLWCRFPADFGSKKGCSPPHLPPGCPDGIQLDLTGFHSLLLTGSRLISFPPPTKMLHFGGLVHITVLSQISGSKTACVYPERFAACRVAVWAQAQPSTKWFVATYGSVLLPSWEIDKTTYISRIISFRSAIFLKENRQNKSCRHFTRMNAFLPFPEGTRDGAPQEFAGQSRSFPPK